MKDFEEIIKKYRSDKPIIVCGLGTSLSLLAKPNDFITIGVNDIERMFTPTFLLLANVRTEFPKSRFYFIEHTKAKEVFSCYPVFVDNIEEVAYRLGDYRKADIDSDKGIDYSVVSTYIATIIAYRLGAKNIGIIGMDLTVNHVFAHSGNYHLEGLSNIVNADFEKLTESLRIKDCNLYNLSPISKVTSIPKISIETFYKLTGTKA